MKTEQEYEWVSVSEMAKRMGVSTQTIYLQLKQGYTKHNVLSAVVHMGG